VENGTLFILGRADDVVIAAGKNVYPEDVESTVLGSPAGANALAVAAFRAPGVDDRFALAVELARDVVDHAAEIGEIRKTLSAEMNIRATPILSVKRWSIPRTSSGKVKRGACAEAFLSSEGADGVLGVW
jgi:acyl-coenzyme A synthetase/AMP-(fatty) acid ligase